MQKTQARLRAIPSGVNWGLVFDVTLDLVNVQVGVVLEVLW